MKLLCQIIPAIILSGLLFGCASSIVDSESIRTSSTIYAPKSENSVVEIHFYEKNLERPYSNLGRVSARSWVLEKGMNALKEEARKLGADAVINIKYERRFSVDYLQDLYFIDGDAIVWK